MDRTQELDEKEGRLWRFLGDLGLEGVLIGRRSNFAWLTGGGANHIFLASEQGACSLLVLPEGKYLLAHTMDGERMMAEEIADQGVELHAHHWYEDRQSLLESLTRGRRIGCDVPTPGLELIRRSWREVFFPLTPSEVGRAREASRLAHEAVTGVCRSVKPGDTELQVAGRLAQAYTQVGMGTSVILVGADERPYRYRHCLPTEKRVQKHLLVHVAGQKYGLHANLTRIVHLGRPPADLAHRHHAVSTVHATILAHAAPGARLADLLPPIQAAYAACGYPEEWRGHIQGGPAAYEAMEADVLLDPQAVMGVNETYDWLPTVPGTKSDEMSLITQDGAELLSLGSDWPTLPIAIEGRTFAMPDILVRD